jgi:hypothetical protein
MTRKFVLNLSTCFFFLAVSSAQASGITPTPHELIKYENIARQLTYVQVNYSNSTIAQYTIVFTNTSTNQEQYFQVNNGSGFLGYVLPGTYNISFTSNDIDYSVYDAGCYDSGNGYGQCVVNNVPIDESCNNIAIYYYH